MLCTLYLYACENLQWHGKVARAVENGWIFDGNQGKIKEDWKRKDKGQEKMLWIFLMC
jgi:hypothetical protein